MPKKNINREMLELQAKCNKVDNFFMKVLKISVVLLILGWIYFVLTVNSQGYELIITF